MELRLHVWEVSRLNINININISNSYDESIRRLKTARQQPAQESNTTAAGELRLAPGEQSIIRIKFLARTEN